MKELLERYGYTYEGKCNCEGFGTDKYKNGDFHLRIRTNKNLFKIKFEGRSLQQWIPIKLLPQTLSNIHVQV